MARIPLSHSSTLVDFCSSHSCYVLDKYGTILSRIACCSIPYTTLSHILRYPVIYIALQRSETTDQFRRPSVEVELLGFFFF